MNRLLSNTTHTAAHYPAKRRLPSKVGTQRPVQLATHQLCCIIGLMAASPALLAQTDDANGTTAAVLNGRAMSGGLGIPSAWVLPQGTAFWAFDTAREPKAGWAKRPVHENYAVGLGLLPNVEITGRLAEYTTPSPQVNHLVGRVNGLRDLSASFKLQLPRVLPVQPDVAIGVSDVAGGAPNFRSTYIVASEAYKGIKATVGYGRGKQLYSGLFYGVEAPLGSLGLAVPGVSILAENDSMLRRAGMRYTSEPVRFLNDARISVVWDRTLGGKAAATLGRDVSSVGVSLSVPLGTKPLRPSGPVAAEKAPLLDTLEKLQDKLLAAGYERVRVGTTTLNGKPTLLVEMEDHRRIRNELDSWGLALGHAGQAAAAGIEQLAVMQLNNGQPMQHVSVAKSAWLDFVSGGPADPVRESLNHGWGPLPLDLGSVQWVDKEASRPVAARFSLTPAYTHFVGTEVGKYDYALAADVGVQVPLPLLPGLVAHGAWRNRVYETVNLKPPQVFADSRFESGLQSLAISYAQWVAPQVLAVVSAGELDQRYRGVQLQGVWLSPTGESQLRGAVNAMSGNGNAVYGGNVRSASVAYRWNHAPTGVFADAAMHRYANGDTGPTLTLGRWFGDVAAQASYRRSDNGTSFIGMTLSIPLAPRQGLERQGYVSADLAPAFDMGLSTVLVTPGSCNCIDSRTARVPAYAMPIERNWLNRSRSGAAYMQNNLGRMRDAWMRLGKSAVE